VVYVSVVMPAQFFFLVGKEVYKVYVFNFVPFDGQRAVVETLDGRSSLFVVGFVRKTGSSL